jgi:hypothetical protein
MAVRHVPALSRQWAVSCSATNVCVYNRATGDDVGVLDRIRVLLETLDPAELAVSYIAG